MRSFGVSLLVVACLWAVGANALAEVPAPAHAARTVKATEHVRLLLVDKRGSKFQHKGLATGTVGGAVRSWITLDSLSLDGTVTIVTKAGSLNLRVRGTARSSGLRAKFDGTATMAGGTGRYAKARGDGRFTGVVNRSTWAATIDASGSLSY